MNDTKPQPTPHLLPDTREGATPQGPNPTHHVWQPPARPVKEGVNLFGVVLCTVVLALAALPWFVQGRDVQFSEYGPYAAMGLGAILLLTGLLGGIAGATRKAATRRRAAATAGPTTPRTPSATP